MNSFSRSSFSDAPEIETRRETRTAFGNKHTEESLGCGSIEIRTGSSVYFGLPIRTGSPQKNKPYSKAWNITNGANLFDKCLHFRKYTITNRFVNLFSYKKKKKNYFRTINTACVFRVISLEVVELFWKALKGHLEDCHWYPCKDNGNRWAILFNRNSSRLLFRRTRKTRSAPYSAEHLKLEPATRASKNAELENFISFFFNAFMERFCGRPNWTTIIAFLF